MHGVEHLLHLEGHALQHRPSDVPPVGVAGDADADPARVLAPPGSEQPVECRHEVDPAGVLHLRCQGLDLRRRADEPQAVTEPLHGGAGDGDGALQGVVGRRRRAQLVRHRGEESVGGPHHLVAGVEEDERPRAVGALGLALSTELPEHGGVLVPQAAGDGDPRQRPPAGDLPDEFRVAHDPGEDGEGDPQGLQRGQIPVQSTEVHQHRPGGVGAVRDVNPPGGGAAAAGEVPDQPCIHRTEEGVAGFHGGPHRLNVLEHPQHLDGAEVGADGQPAGLHKVGSSAGELLLQPPAGSVHPPQKKTQESSNPKRPS